MEKLSYLFSALSHFTWTTTTCCLATMMVNCAQYTLGRVRGREGGREGEREGGGREIERGREGGEKKEREEGSERQ